MGIISDYRCSDLSRICNELCMNYRPEMIDICIARADHGCIDCKYNDYRCEEFKRKHFGKKPSEVYNLDNIMLSTYSNINEVNKHD